MSDEHPSGSTKREFCLYCRHVFDRGRMFCPKCGHFNVGTRFGWFAIISILLLVGMLAVLIVVSKAAFILNLSFVVIFIVYLIYKYVHGRKETKMSEGKLFSTASVASENEPWEVEDDCQIAANTSDNCAEKECHPFRRGAIRSFKVVAIAVPASCALWFVYGRTSPVQITPAFWLSASGALAFCCAMCFAHSYCACRLGTRVANAIFTTLGAVIFLALILVLIRLVEIV